MILWLGFGGNVNNDKPARTVSNPLGLLFLLSGCRGTGTLLTGSGPGTTRPASKGKGRKLK
jgi:hypothetical protein